MNILLASSEVHPYSKTGGLADMVGALAKSLAREGHTVSLITPLYAGIREKLPELKPHKVKLDLPLGGKYIHGGLWSIELEKNLKVYFVEQPEFFDRAGIYHEKWREISRACRGTAA